MKKIVLLDDHFATGEQTIQPVFIVGRRQDTSRITKTASEALDYIKHVIPEPGKTNMLVLALGSEEAYGPNRNGDGFPERPVRARNGKDMWIKPGEELTKHYKTFETNPAHAFKHHVNKDPAKASGHVKKAFWNDKMHRVELLIVVDNKLDPEWVDRVNDGDFPAVSMGCRIKHDVCSICGNEAPTRAQYCDHAKFQMNQLMPDGRKCYVHNPSPNFFDISRVFRPADRTGYTLKKVAEAYEVRSSAELGEIADALVGKSAAIRKVSDIDKIIRGEPVASSSNLSPHEQKLIKNFKDYLGPKLSSAPNLPMDVLRKHAAVEVFSTTRALGIALKDTEFVDFMVSKLAGTDVTLPAVVHEKIAAIMPQIYDLFESSPALCDEVLSAGVLDTSVEKISAELVEALEPYRIKRAYVGEMLHRRLVPEGIGLRADEAPRTDMLTYNDPTTGQTLRTTRGAAVDMQDATTTAHMRKAVGGAALLLGGYKALTSKPGLIKTPLAVGAGLLGVNLMRNRPGHDVMTNEGVAIPHMTEFAPKTGSDESYTGLVVNLLESYNPGSRKHASFADSTVKALKNDGMVDGIRGLELNLETAADELGRLICS